MDLSKAQQAIRHGAIAAFFSAGVTLAVVLYALNAPDPGPLALWRDPANFLDVAILVFCAIGLLLRSRVAAVLLVIYFVISKVSIAVELGKPSGVGTALVFLYFFARAVQGSFAYHRLRREADAAYRPSWKLATVITVPAVLLLPFLSLGLLSTLQIVPSTAVITGEQMRDRDRQLLLSHQLLAPDEQPLLFYSHGLRSILEDGNLLTDRRLVSYEQGEHGLQMYAAALNEIAEVNLLQQGDGLQPTVLEVWTASGDGFRLFLSAEKGGDRQFIETLLQRIRAYPDHVLQEPAPEQT